VSARNREKLSAFAKNWGWEAETNSWQELIDRKDIDLVDICAPNNVHREMVLAAAERGKFIVCEKPLAMNSEEGREMVAAVEGAQIENMVCFNYRRVPAIALAKQLIEEGRLGRIFHYRSNYLQDWTVDPDLPQGGQTLWRLDAAVAGSGVTGDLLSHAIDLGQWLVAPITEVSAMTETFIKNRPVHGTDGQQAPVTIDDACAFLCRFQNGALGTFEATRYATGRKNFNTFEVNGELGSISFDLENAHVLKYYDRRDDAQYRGFREIRVWDGDHPYMGAWWVPGCAIGYEHTFTHMISDFLSQIESGPRLCPDMRDGLATQMVCDAVLESAATRKWAGIEKIG
jgi:predicted dehydrogenase